LPISAYDFRPSRWRRLMMSFEDASRVAVRVDADFGIV